MSGKKISNGTLSLRFMQNAQRVQNQKTAELEKAEVKDAEEWSIPKAIQDSWNTPGSSETVSHERSYLPFIFSEADTDEPSTKLNGRRVFKKGAEVKKGSSSTSNDPPAIPEESEIPAPQSEHEDAPPSRVEDQAPRSLSAVLSPKVKKSADGPSAKSAKQSLFEPANVGTDIRPPPRPQGFMKPAGVDDPKASPSDPDILMGTREKKKKRSSEDATSNAPKRKKKTVT